MIAQWPCSGAGGPVEELAVAFDRQRPLRLLVVPPLFEEMNRTRRLLVETLRRLDAGGIDGFLPDLPGCNESPQRFADQSLYAWRNAMAQAARHFAATHVLAVRGGALVFPVMLPGWVLEPIKGATILRQLLRARIMAAREAGRDEDTATLLEIGRSEGLDLSGYRCSAALIAGLEAARPEDEGQIEIRQADLGGGGALWLRAEPGEDAAQADALARRIIESIAA